MDLHKVLGIAAQHRLQRTSAAVSAAKRKMILRLLSIVLSAIQEITSALAANAIRSAAFGEVMKCAICKNTINYLGSKLCDTCNCKRVLVSKTHNDPSIYTEEYWIEIHKKPSNTAG